jgi:hypothetical protein
MPITVPGRGARNHQNTDDYVITIARARCLAELITRPYEHVARFVEQLSFKDSGGQEWHRLLQIQIPTAAAPARRGWWVVPLGPFRRRRFPDIHVEDADGRRVNFVTRKQHGAALTKAVLSKQFTESFAADIDSVLEEEPNRRRYARLRSGLFAFYTKIGDDLNREQEARGLIQQYSDLLAGLPALGISKEQAIKDFSADLAAAAGTTQYLCWVQASPGDVINLRVSHSTRDPKHKLESGNCLSLTQSLAIGIFGRLFRVSLSTCREVWNRWYVHYGLSPIPYAFNIPTYDYTTSYYSTIDPPDNTVVSYLDWERGNSWESWREVDSSLDSIHIFRGPSIADGSPSHLTTRAYLRCSPHHHKLLLGAALMSMALVILVAVGRFPSDLGDPLQTLVTATPSVLLAFLAQQQRHYYAHALRRIRGILWVYLSIEVLFLVAVAFSDPVDNSGTPGLGWKATTAAWLLGASSVFVFVWQFPLGQSYERVVRYLTARKKALVQRGKDWSPTRWQRLRLWLGGSRWDTTFTADWQCYEVAVEQYSRLIRRALFGAVLVTLGLLGLFWHPAVPEVHREKHGSRAILVSR